MIFLIRISKVAFYLLILIQVSSCSLKPIKAPDFRPGAGHLSIIQVATSDKETYINILKGKNASYKYYVSEKETPNIKKEILPYKTLNPIQDFQWSVDKIHIENLEVNKNYELSVFHKKFKREVDRRAFKALNIKKSHFKFITASCLSENKVFTHIIPKMWELAIKQKPDFFILLGDNVYVDDFDVVARNEKVSQRDIWQRYVDTFHKIPLYQNYNLTPVLAIWDDHDFGTNDATRYFPQKKTAKEAFLAFFASPEIPQVMRPSKHGVSYEFNAFQQKFLFLDNRWFREKRPSKNDFSYFGEAQRNWVRSQIQKNNEQVKNTPLWLVNGGQFFSQPFLIRSGKQVNESFMTDYPKSHKSFMSDLKTSNSKAIFLSGDVHMSEILKIEREILGYESFEITSSPMHALLYRDPNPKYEIFSNPRRLKVVKEYNFVLIEVKKKNSHKNNYFIKVKSLGLKNSNGYFQQEINF